ncbi:MFS transporter [Pseudorhodoferax sp. Leaf265]|jgi:MFS family permease|uniref:MFS transporter n=1 Tax=Pseudorhodoferax sp. Leaf265 TaxID=1736315 RepID=UPI0006F5F8FE|nr:MFS transporter [Pseudorhodoferax sp. Leaf265]KQP02803.1 arabinose ABC transporter permease [Pseudorhodoferax sp. Leaf265]
MPEERPSVLTPDEASSPDADLSTLAPLRWPVFRMLWLVWLASNICMWMNDVAAAWLMTSLTTSPVWVALVQTAATMPVFLFGLPSGALADIVDRRRFYITTQFWVASVALLLCATVLTGTVTPPLLLLLTFANGIGLAMRWPVYSAVVPELIPRAQLPAALALNGITMNASRIVGPLLAGALIASIGSAAVFVLNAVLSLASAFMLMRWKREHKPDPLGRQRLWSAMRVGVQFVRQSPRLKAVLLRIALFFFHSTALIALLPLVARGLQGGDAATFTVLLASMGMGAIATAFLMPRLRQLLARDQVVLYGTLLQSGATLVMAFASNVAVAVPAMFVAGMAWIATANSLSVSAQLALPDWVRARGMSIYQMAIMGASAFGAGLWGQVAALGTVQLSLLVAALTGGTAMWLATRFVVDLQIEEDLSPSHALPVPVAAQPPATGHVLVSIDYRIDPTRAADFERVMQDSRRSRLAQGALEWHLLRDISDPGHYTEQIVDESWTEHLRRFDRVTGADIALRERKLAFHLEEAPPRVTRYAIDTPRT